MADLTGRREGERDGPRRSGGRRDRGQIILIAAFALAVTFVALAIVVNSAIFTENLASRGETAGTDEALFLRHELVSVIGEAVGYANVHNTTALDSSVRSGVANATRAVELQHAAAGAYVNASFRPGSIVSGSRIAQNETTDRPLTSAGGDADWTVVEDVSRPVADANGTRAFEMDLATSSLSSGPSGSFNVTVDGSGGATWRMGIWRDSAAPSEVIVGVRNGDGDAHRCRTAVTDSTVAVDLTRGTVEGEPCSALRWHLADPALPTRRNYQFAAGVAAPYSIAFEDGTAAEGNYSLVTTNASIGSSNALNAGGSRTSPYATDAVYSLRVDYAFERPRMRYSTEVRIAPGESA